MLFSCIFENANWGAQGLFVSTWVHFDAMLMPFWLSWGIWWHFCGFLLPPFSYFGVDLGFPGFPLGRNVRTNFKHDPKREPNGSMLSEIFNFGSSCSGPRNSPVCWIVFYSFGVVWKIEEWRIVCYLQVQTHISHFSKKTVASQFWGRFRGHLESLFLPCSLFWSSVLHVICF